MKKCTQCAVYIFLIYIDVLVIEEPGVTIGHVIEFFKEHKVTALGIGSFGPMNINQISPH